MELVLKFDTRDHFCCQIEIDIRGVRENIPVLSRIATIANGQILYCFAVAELYGSRLNNPN